MVLVHGNLFIYPNWTHVDSTNYSAVYPQGHWYAAKIETGE